MSRDTTMRLFDRALFIAHDIELRFKMPSGLVGQLQPEFAPLAHAGPNDLAEYRLHRLAVRGMNMIDEAFGRQRSGLVLQFAVGGAAIDPFALLRHLHNQVGNIVGDLSKLFLAYPQLLLSRLAQTAFINLTKRPPDAGNQPLDALLEHIIGRALFETLNRTFLTHHAGQQDEGDMRMFSLAISSAASPSNEGSE